MLKYTLKGRRVGRMKRKPMTKMTPVRRTMRKGKNFHCK